MRIISGKHRGRIINPPKTFSARPTTDMAKESLFNIIANRYDFEDMVILDLFAGTGSIGYEFASRGAKEIVCVEKDYNSYSFINNTALQMQLPLKCIRANVFTFLKNCSAPYDIIFADPPYDMPDSEKTVDLVFENHLLKEDGIMIFEHSKRLNFTSHSHFSELRTYGKVHFSFFTLKNNFAEK